MSIARSDLAAVICGALAERVETIFGDSVRTLGDDGARVRVELESGTTRDFDLVIGADGLHSQVRALVFGPEERFEKYLGITVAAFDIEGYRPRDELVAVMHTKVGYQVTRFPMRDDMTMCLFTFVDDGRIATRHVVRKDVPATLLIAVAFAMGQAMDTWLMTKPLDDEALRKWVPVFVGMLRRTLSP